MKTLPISKRKRDWFFVIAFGVFICSSIITDSVNGLNGQLDPDSSYSVEKFIYHSYAKICDPLLIKNPPQVRVSAWISAFIWLPLYVIFILGFLKGWNSIRTPALIYGGALTHGMITYMAEGMFGEVARTGYKLLPLCTEPQTWRYFFINIPYLLVPLLVIIRMWKENPFSAVSAKSDKKKRR